MAYVLSFGMFLNLTHYNYIMTNENELMDFEKVLDFQKILTAISKKDEGRFHSKHPSKFSPTELSGCIRNSYFNRLFPEEYDDKSYMNFLYGNIMHELFQDNLDYRQRDKVLKGVLGEKISYIENEKAFHYLLPLEKTNNQRIVISGRLDTIIYLKDNPVPIVVDYKTTGAIKYSMNEPKSTHVSQLMFYLGCMLADYGILVYINKPDLRIVQHTVPWDATIFNDMVDFAIDLKHAIDTTTPPDITVVQMEQEGYCSYCKHKDKCKAVEAEKCK